MKKFACVALVLVLLSGCSQTGTDAKEVAGDNGVAASNDYVSEADSHADEESEAEPQIVTAKELADCIEKNRNPILSNSTPFSYVADESGAYYISTLTAIGSPNKMETGSVLISADKETDSIIGIMVQQTILPPTDFVEVVAPKIGISPENQKVIIDQLNGLSEAKETSSNVTAMNEYQIMTGMALDDSGYLSTYTFFAKNSAAQ